MRYLLSFFLQLTCPSSRLGVDVGFGAGAGTGTGAGVGGSASGFLLYL